MRKKQIIVFFAVSFIAVLIGAALLIMDSYDYRKASIKMFEHNKTELTEIAREILKSETKDSSNIINQLPEQYKNILYDASVYWVGVQDGDKVHFTIKTTGLFDGGVEYGIYYSDNNADKLDLSTSHNDFMIIERLDGNWFYYEWHNG